MAAPVDFEVCDDLLSRIHTTAGQRHLYAFSFNRAGYIAAKSEIDAASGTIFGVLFCLIDAQKQRCLALWSEADFKDHLAKFA